MNRLILSAIAVSIFAVQAGASSQRGPEAIPAQLR